MSDRDYIAWSLLVAGSLVVLGLALRWLGRRAPAKRWGEALHAARGKRLQRRLDKRLARGSDNYFEELRSIESAIADYDKGWVSGQPPRLRFRTVYAVLAVYAILCLGFMLTNVFAPTVFGAEAPQWANRLSFFFFPAMGAQMVLDSYQPGAWSPWGQRLLGGLLTVMFVIIGGAEIARWWSHA